jgi:hypothetical protein
MIREIIPSYMAFAVSKLPSCNIEKMNYMMANGSKCVERFQRIVVPFHETYEMGHCPRG